ncbi:hypothetical protein Tco_1028395 [Tanacetum coccineum]|uniref:Protein CHLOROPLAST IMPORT APPARATUS 2 n=1 Tax=Tanacetum coccineum TaxID=301880 RepID=A0ABQ5G216_9ASTR
MSSYLSGGTGRAYGFDIENILKYQSTTTTSSRTSHSNSSSPSSTLSETSNSPIAISHRKPRTPRKRPNQTYNEAAVLLSIACPKVFSSKNITKNKSNNVSKFTRMECNSNSIHETPELLFPFPVIENSSFLLHDEPNMEKPSSLFGSSKVGIDGSQFRGSPELDSGANSMELCDGYEEDFDTESILDEEMEEGIDSIMGVSSNSSIENIKSDHFNTNSKTCYGYPMGLGFGGNLEFNFGFGYGMRHGIRALKNSDDGNWWQSPAVNMVNVSPATATVVTPVKAKKASVEKKKKKVEEIMKRSESEMERNWNLVPVPEIRCDKPMLKLNYAEILNAWSDKASPLPEELSGSESPGGDIHVSI